jgi:hypothetical protein
MATKIDQRGTTRGKRDKARAAAERATAELTALTGVAAAAADRYAEAGHQLIAAIEALIPKVPSVVHPSVLPHLKTMSSEINAVISLLIGDATAYTKRLRNLDVKK